MSMSIVLFSPKVSERLRLWQSVTQDIRCTCLMMHERTFSSDEIPVDGDKIGCLRPQHLLHDHDAFPILDWAPCFAGTLSKVKVTEDGELEGCVCSEMDTRFAWIWIQGVDEWPRRGLRLSLESEVKLKWG